MFCLRKTCFTVACLLIIIVIPFNAFCQMYPPNPTVPAASIAGNKQSLEVSNDLYNGKLNVSIPLYAFDFEGINFPFALNYTASNGIKPDELPGWVGSGWDLQGSGYVHRTVRGEADERLEFETTIHDFYDLAQHPNYEKQTQLNLTDYSYLKNCLSLRDTYWYTQGFANSKSASTSNWQAFDGSNAYEAWRTYNSYPTYDLVPDEFSFSFGNISGKFYLNQDTTWLVQASDGMKYEVHVETGDQTVIDYMSYERIFYKIPRIIKYITLTSTNGIKYVFGNENVSAPFEEQYFDYSHTSETKSGVLSTTPPSAFTDANVAPTYLDIIPHTWHLTKIENLKTGSVITFGYKEQQQFYRTLQPFGQGANNNINNGYLVYNNNQTFYSSPDNPNSGFRGSAMARVMTRGWTLTSINFPNGVKINFNSIASTQLSTNENVFDSYECGFYNFEDVGGGNNTLQQLNNIIVIYKDEVRKNIKFNYVLSASQRLQLSSVTENDILNHNTGTYSFTYYTEKQLPGYASTKLDHWGYFNGKDFFQDVAPPYGYTNLSNYYSYREPDEAFAKAEILTKVTLPTGGFMAFEYEAHKYSKKRSNYYTVTDLSADLKAGGLRIQKIRHYLQDGVLAMEKVYEYTRPGGLSSGVLAIPQATYFSAGSEAWGFSAAGYNPIYYDGNHVTYTFVTEKQVGNGKTEFEFTNYDNGYGEAQPMQNNNGSVEWGFVGAYVRNGFKRGKLIHAYVSSETGRIKETDYHYEHEKSEASKDELRSLYLGIWAASPTNYYTSVLEKIYPDHLYSQEERTITSQGTFTNKTFTTYDQYGNVSETYTLDSEGKKIRQKFKYCYEYSSAGTDDVSLGIKKLNELGIKSQAIEALTIRENADGSAPVVIGAVLNVFKANMAFLDRSYDLKITDPIPLSSFTLSTVSGGAFLKDLRYLEPELTVNNYDQRGNILQLTTKAGIKESFQWGYASRHIVAKVLNAGNVNGAKEFYYEGLEEGGGGQNIAAYAGNYCRSGDFTVEFLQPNPKSYVIDYWYFDSNKWNYIKKPYVYGMLLSEGSAIDEVRVYPVDARITTYTYSILKGLTSETDPNGKTLFYEYDEFGRLAVIRDKDRNVIKTVCYNFAGETENCNYSYNDAISQTYTRNDCPYSPSGSQVTYTVPAGKYLSSINKATANQMAQAELDAMGQNFANTTGTCPPFYIKFSVEELGPTSTTEYANIKLEFFKDAACTIPLTVNNLVLNWARAEYLYNGNEYHLYEFTSAPISGTYTYLLHNAITYEEGFNEIYYYYSNYYYYSLSSNPYYQVIYNY